jgi:thiosulfate/3-mercaptopyruvate sulfurtransferase
MLRQCTKAALIFIFSILASHEAHKAMAAEHPEVFIMAETLQKIVVAKNPQQRLVIAEVGWGGPADYYDKGHIPGAIHVNTDEIEYDLFKKRSAWPADKLERSTSIREDQVKGLSADDELPRNWWNIYPDKYLLPALADMGIDIDSTVVVYGKDISGAARLAWTLFYAGVKDVRMLDGGLEAWKRAGYPVTTAASKRAAVASFGATRALHPEYRVNIAYVREVVNGKRPDAVIADIRTRGEYEGATAPYSYIPTKGRIKGALWGQAGDGPWSMEAYVEKDGRLKAPKEIEAMWAKRGIVGDKHVSFYCGTAWRSSLAFLYAYRLGWPNIANFDSSWYEWSMGPEAAMNPVE